MIGAEIKPENRNTAEFFIKISKPYTLSAEIERALKNGLDTVGENLKRQLVFKLISPPKTGRLYPVMGAQHKASAPGEAPANRTGNLIQSIYHDVLSHNRLEFGETAKYAKYLEDGTKKKGSNTFLMKPRPHLRPVVEENNYKINEMIVEALDAALPD